MAPVVDSEGIMTDPDLHDGLLFGIILHPDRKELTVLCQDVEGMEFRVTVTEIVRFRVDEFLEGNIISDVWIREGDNCPQESIRRVFGYDDDNAKRYLPEDMKEIKDGRWTLVEVSTSYGCELFALSRAHADRITVA